MLMQKIESKRLQFLRKEQDHLIADIYKDLREPIVNQDGDPKNVGRKVIMPGTFCGGPRNIFERQQVGMTYAKKTWPTRFIDNRDNKSQVA